LGLHDAGGGRTSPGRAGAEGVDVRPAGRAAAAAGLGRGARARSAGPAGSAPHQLGGTRGLPPTHTDSPAAARNAAQPLSPASGPLSGRRSRVPPRAAALALLRRRRRGRQRPTVQQARRALRHFRVQAGQNHFFLLDLARCCSCNFSGGHNCSPLVALSKVTRKGERKPKK